MHGWLVVLGFSLALALMRHIGNLSVYRLLWYTAAITVFLFGFAL